MKMKQMLLGAVAAVGLMATAVVDANAFEGGWLVRNNPGGREILYLGDNSDNTFRALRGTDRYCGQRGSSYATMRRVLGNVTSQVTWWEDRTCDDGYVRVCVANTRGQSACSTYIDRGWVDGDENGEVAWWN